MKIPRYDDVVDRAPLPGARQQTIAGPELFTAGQRQAAQAINAADRAVDANDAIVQKMQDRIDADAVFRVESQNNEAIIEFQRVGKEQTGKKAEGLTARTKEFFGKLQGEALAKAEGPRQTRLIEQGLAKRRQQMLDWAAGHESAEQRRSLNEATIATIETNNSLAAANAFNEKMLGELRGETLRRLEASAQLNGQDEKVAARAREEALSKMHLGVIQARADADVTAAERYFDSYKGEIDGTIHDDIADLFKRAKADANAAIKNQTEAAQKQASDEAWQHYAERGTLPPIGVLKRMDGKDRQALQDKYKADIKGEPIKTNIDSYFNVRMLATSDPKKFASLDLRTYAGSISAEDLKGLAGMQEQVKKGAGGEVVSLERQLSGMHAALGFKPTDRAKIWDFDRKATDAIAAEQKRIGKALSHDERQAVLDRLVVDGRISRPGWFNDVEGRAYQLQNEPDFGQFEPEIPDEDRKLIEAALTKEGKPITDEAVADKYKRKHGLK